MEPGYLIDTNVIIDNFGNKLPLNANVFLKSVQPVISAVTKIEVLGWRNATKEQLSPLFAFMQISTILPISDAVINKTIEIRQSYKIGLGDAIIAATALLHDLILISRNVTDFNKLTGLQIIDPHTL